jgi:hypothetical protein
MCDVRALALLLWLYWLSEHWLFFLFLVSCFLLLLLLLLPGLLCTALLGAWEPPGIATARQQTAKGAGGTFSEVVEVVEVVEAVEVEVVWRQWRQWRQWRDDSQFPGAWGAPCSLEPPAFASAIKHQTSNVIKRAHPTRMGRPLGP